jgi:radical SAM superfamily enzyme YgiQ (UPF0313 family)
MKALLVSPKGNVSNNFEFLNFWNQNPVVKPYRETFTGVSTGLLILATFMKKDFDLTFIDENRSTINYDSNYDLVAISCMTQQSTRAYQIADEFRKRKIKVIIGGIHPTLLREEAKLHADSVFVGEVENTWEEFRKDFFSNNIKSFYINESQCDLKNSPIPSYELLNPNDYRVVWVQTTRGCPHKCEFCVSSNIFGSKFRHKKIEQVVEEIEKIKSIWKKPIMISFADDNMFVNRKYSNELLHALIPLKIRWFAQTDISVAQDNDLLTLMKKSGASILFIGFETITKKGLSIIDQTSWKPKQLKNYESSIKQIQSHGIGIMGAFIVGLDTDTKRSFNNISKFIIKNHIYASQITILTPFPGTRLRERLEKEGRILSSNWEKYTIWDAVLKPKNMTVKELESGWLSIYKKIYDKDVQISNAKHFKEIYRNIN